MILSDDDIVLPGDRCQWGIHGGVITGSSWMMETTYLKVRNTKNFEEMIIWRSPISVNDRKALLYMGVEERRIQ
jgi:hypothetical protein